MAVNRNHHCAKTEMDTTRKSGRLGFNTHSDNLDDLLQVVHDKVVKLKNGENDPKIKANLIKIATERLQSYIENGGDLNRAIVDKKTGKRVTANELQEQIVYYKGR